MSKMKILFLFVWFFLFFFPQLNRVKLVEKEKNALESEKNKAVDFLTLENDIFRHKSRLCQYHVWVLQRLFKTWNNYLFTFCVCGSNLQFLVVYDRIMRFFNTFLSHDLQKRVVDKEEEKKKIEEDTKELTEQNTKITQEIEKMNQELKNVEK